MSTDYEAGKAALETLIGWAGENVREIERNEATTRFHLIDTLLVDVLRWPREIVTTEERVPEGYVDYVLGHPIARGVLEAKRETTTFTLPVGLTSGVYPISTITDGTGGRELRSALDQVSTYAARRGCTFAAVSNGTQLVLFLGTRSDGISPLEGRALVYMSLAEMREDFRRLWDNFSPAGVDARQLYRTLQVTVAPPPEPLSATINGYPGVAGRSNLQSGLEVLGGLFVEDLTRLADLRESFLRECYATSGALSQYAAVSRQILQTRYALLREELGSSSVSPVQDRRGISPDLTQDLLAAATSQRPIVLLGDVGVGKTTFIQRLVHVEAPEVFAESYTIYVDFGRQAALGDDLAEFVLEECATQLRERYSIDVDEADFAEAVHHGHLNRFDKGVSGRLKDIDPVAYARERIAFLNKLVQDRPRHVQAALEHLRANRRKQIVIFLDNIDQRTSEDQEQVFLIAVSLASTWPASVFVTLRPDTFYRSKKSGTLAAYQPRVFTIAPPRTDIMLQRRIEFALKQLKETGRLETFPVGVTVDSESLTLFLEMLADNFHRNEPLLSLIDNVASGNMRLALEVVTSFIGSGHIDTSKILEICRATGRYVIPVHEFLRSILYGDNRYFDPSDSPIANLFSIGSPDGREHFLTPIILTHIQALGERGPDEGYLRGDTVFQYCQSLGFDAEQVTKALESAVERRLIERAPRYSGDAPTLHYRITQVGAYTVRTLLALFSYVDAVTVDTPIVDSRYKALVSNAYSLSERLSRAEYFRIYLDRQWQPLQDVASGEFDWLHTSEKLRNDIFAIGRRADPANWPS